ncbi:MAG: Gfo/Idh/MocA family oxidoreductase [Gemmatimonadales bacterium]|nr:Gfo/Idh/MocA family oxidoreductase [Gemmatimonadales bacterium]
MTRVKIIGAGSIGNHLAHAARRKDWSVTVCDISAAALERMRREIYPGRYGQWDEQIQLFESAKAPRGEFDLICIGTPPDSHVSLALAALEEAPTAILVEKPLCPPSLEGADQLLERARTSPTRVFVGYDHVVGRAIRKTEALLRDGGIGAIKTIDVEFREHWAGIFRAHPWLNGPEDSYLGFWQAGGGASGEHSHAANLWQHLAHLTGAGPVVEVESRMAYVRDGKAWYDELCYLTLQTSQGLLGRVVQDVVTTPTRKWARIQGTEGAVEWICESPTRDVVRVLRPGQEPETHELSKSRPDDFIDELSHIESCWAAPAGTSPIALERGHDTMLVIAAAHQSAAERRPVRVSLSAAHPVSGASA